MRSPEKMGTGLLRRLLLQFHQPLIYILLAAGTVTALLQEWVDAGVIFGVVLVNAFIGFIQEAKAVKAIEALSRTMRTEATVVRAGEKLRISSAEVVPGDIVLRLTREESFFSGQGEAQKNITGGGQVSGNLRREGSSARLGRQRDHQTNLSCKRIPQGRHEGRLP